jgi:hypothetical protein
LAAVRQRDSARAEVLVEPDVDATDVSETMSVTLSDQQIEHTMTIEVWIPAHPAS